MLDFFRPRRVYERTVQVAVASVRGMGPAELYATQPALRSVISFLADNIAGLPLKCYVRESDDDRARDTGSALAKTLHDPNPWQTGHELVRAVASEYLLFDRAICYSVPSNEMPGGWFLAVIPNTWVVETKTADGFGLSAVKVRNPHTGREATFGADDLLVFGGWAPYGIGGQTRVSALKEMLAEQASAWNFRNSVWRNGGRVTQYITRPANAAPWSDSARDRFAKSWKARFAGDGGTDTGGTPLLEDGMELRAATFNAREAQWAETLKLTREDVCAVYHVNPGLVYHTDAQTYASAKDNARALYSDTLAPVLDFLEERLNKELVPALGLDARHYCEFDLDAKLQGSFEERTSVLQSSVGAPWMTRNEARGLMNLPAIAGADELVVPLNVTEGGLASPNDTAGGYYSATAGTKSEPICIKARGGKAASREITDAMRRFFERQGRSVTAALGKARKAEGDWPEWWDAERWNRELAADLAPIFQRIAAMKGEAAAETIGGDFDPELITNYIKAMAEGKAKATNDVTYRQLVAALDGELSEDAEGSTPEGVFEKAAEVRAETSGRSFATALAGFATLEAVRQNGRTGARKTWVVTSGNPRASHAAMDGETVGYSEPFSNGAQFPGDQALDAEETCNCQCAVDIYV